MRKDRVTLWLEEWGRHYLAGMEYEGYSSISSIVLVIEDQVDRMLRPKHKILCRDLPEHVWPVHYAVLDLPDIYRVPLVLRFIPVLRMDGTHFRQRELAELIHLDKTTFRVRVRRGKDIVKGSLPDRYFFNKTKALRENGRIRSGFGLCRI